MNITDVRVRILKKDDAKLKAVASIIIDGDFAIHDIKIIEGAEGDFIVMPSRKAPDGTFKDVAHPIKTEVREYMKTVILEEYEKVKKEQVAD